MSCITLHGVTLGLLISSFAKTPDMAVTIVPIVLIPQIVFAGMLGPLKGAAAAFGKGLIANYWTLRGALPEWMAEYEMPGTATLALKEPIALPLALGVLLFLSAAAVAVASLYLNDLRAKQLWKLLQQPWPRAQDLLS